MKNPFATVTTDSIVASFAKTIDQLRAHVERKQNEADIYDVQIMLLEDKADAADLEAVRAQNIALKIESLLA